MPNRIGRQQVGRVWTRHHAHSCQVHLQRDDQRGRAAQALRRAALVESSQYRAHPRSRHVRCPRREPWLRVPSAPVFTALGLLHAPVDLFDCPREQPSCFPARSQELCPRFRQRRGPSAAAVRHHCGRVLPFQFIDALLRSTPRSDQFLDHEHARRLTRIVDLTRPLAGISLCLLPAAQKQVICMRTQEAEVCHADRNPKIPCVPCRREGSS